MWLSWFRSYLEVPLNTVKTMGDDQKVKKRKRGIAMPHALEKYLGEMILVYMDVAVKCEADLLLYGMHDDIVLCGSTARCERHGRQCRDSPKSWAWDSTRRRQVLCL